MTITQYAPIAFGCYVLNVAAWILFAVACVLAIPAMLLFLLCAVAWSET